MGKGQHVYVLSFFHVVNACVKDPFLTSIHCTRPWLSVATSSKLIIPQATAKQCKPHSREYHDKNRDAQCVIANTGSEKLINGTIDVVWFSLTCRRVKV